MEDFRRRRRPIRRKQLDLLRQLIALLKDEELIAMTNHLLSDLDLEELREYPVLWGSYQRWERRTKAAATRDATREHILEALVTRFNPPPADYRTVEQALAALDDAEGLNTLFRHVLLVRIFATVATDLVGDG